MEIINLVLEVMSVENTVVVIFLSILGIVFLFSNRKMISLETKSKFDDMKVFLANLEKTMYDNLNNRTCKHHELNAEIVGRLQKDFEILAEDSEAKCIAFQKNLSESIAELTKKDNEVEERLKDIANSISSMHISLENLAKCLSEHSMVLSMYGSHEVFLKEIRETFAKSFSVLESQPDELRKASAYLLFVAEIVVDVEKYVNKQGLLSINSVQLDAKLAVAINECKKQMGLFYDEEVVRQYFSNNLPVWDFKKKLFQLIESRKQTNNVERSFRTMTITFCEQLCNNFLTNIYFKKAGKNGNR